MLGLSLGNCLSAPLAWRYNRNEMLQDQPGKWMKKVMNTKVAGEDNHVEMMVGYKPAAVDTSTSCKKKTTQTLDDAWADDLTDRSKGNCDET